MTPMLMNPDTPALESIAPGVIISLDIAPERIATPARAGLHPGLATPPSPPTGVAQGGNRPRMMRSPTPGSTLGTCPRLSQEAGNGHNRWILNLNQVGKNHFSDSLEAKRSENQVQWADQATNTRPTRLNPRKSPTHLPSPCFQPVAAHTSCTPDTWQMTRKTTSPGLPMASLTRPQTTTLAFTPVKADPRPSHD